MKIGVYGMGRFGTLWATLLAQHPSTPIVLVGSRSTVLHPPQHCQTATLAELATTDILFLTVAISALQEVLATLAPLLSPHTIVCDTCSVKSYPCELLTTIIPRTNHVIGTHPLFGPDSSNLQLQHPSNASNTSNMIGANTNIDEGNGTENSTSPPALPHTDPTNRPTANSSHKPSQPLADDSAHTATVPHTQPQSTNAQQVVLVSLRPASPSYASAITKCTDLLSGIGCQVVIMSATEHDKQVAQIQGLTHLIGRTLATLKLKPHQLRTLGYTKLLEVMQQTCNDSMELFIDLQRYNPYTRSMVQQVVRSLNTIQQKIDSADTQKKHRRER